MARAEDYAKQNKPDLNKYYMFSRVGSKCIHVSLQEMKAERETIWEKEEDNEKEERGGRKH